MRDVKKILVFCDGSLGDHLVALPAIWVLREEFPGASFSLLSHQRRAGRVKGSEIFEKSGIFDQFFNYLGEPEWQKKYFIRPLSLLRVLIQLRFNSFDAVAYLVVPGRKKHQILRDSVFFKLAGIKIILGMDGFQDTSARNTFNPEASHHADAILSRLKLSGLEIPPPGRGRTDLNLTETENEVVEKILNGLAADGGRPWIAIAHGTNQAQKAWPLSWYSAVVQRLVDKYNVWPVVIGGAGETKQGEDLIFDWKRGYNLAGRLSVRQTAFILKRCKLYFGTDSGPMHLAATVHKPCAVLFYSQKDIELWGPYGVSCKPILITQSEKPEMGLSAASFKEENIRIQKIFESCCELLEPVMAAQI